jgi:hypothetical protein
MSKDHAGALGDTSTPEAFYETLKAERECWKVYLAYFYATDHTGSAKDAAACFTENTQVRYSMRGSEQLFNGREEYHVFLGKSLAAYQMVSHVVGQQDFTWSNGTPRLTTNVISWQWFKTKADAGDLRPADFATIGHAEDEFEFVNGKWLISKRLVRPAAGITAIGIPPYTG